MAWRQPYRSGLRALAEGLLRKVETERAYSQIEQQLLLRKGEIGANLAQGLTENVQTGIQGLVQEPVPETYDTGAIRDAISNEIEGLTRDIGQMSAQGVTGREVEQARSLLRVKQSLLSLPDSQLPAAYQETVGTPLTSALPGIPGQSWLPTTPDLTGSDIISRATAGGMEAKADADTDTALIANILPRLTFRNDDPMSIADAFLALSQVDALSPAARGRVAGQANAVREAARSPEVQAILAQRARDDALDRRIRSGQATEIEIGNRRAQKELDFFVATAPGRVRAVYRDLDEQAQGLVATAFDTGVLTGLDDELRGDLATMLGIEPDRLDEWAQGRAERRARLDVLDEQRTVLDNQLAGLNITIAGQNILEGWEESTHNRWQRTNEIRAEDHQRWVEERERGFAPMQDERTVSEMIAGAITNNDTALLDHYIYAIREGTPLGIQLQTFGGPDLLNQLTEAKAVAVEMQALEMAELRDNDQLRDLTIQDARARLDAFKESSPLELERLRLQIAQGRTDLTASELALLEDRARFSLLPLELEALRVEYARDIAMAERDIRGLPLEEAGSTLATLGEIARAVPPEYWDSPPDYVERSLEKMGLSLDVFKGISIFEEWLRQEPVRAEAWQQLELLVQSPPMDDAARDTMMANVEELGWRMGLNPTARSGLMSAVASIWNEKDAILRQRLLQMATGALTGEDPVDIKRALDGMSSLANSLRVQFENVEPRRLSDMGCATEITFGVLGQPMWNWKPNLSTIAVDDKGTTCYDMKVAYDSLGAQIGNVNRLQANLANMLSGSVGGGTTVSPSNSGNTTPPPSGNNEPIPSPRGDVDWGQYGVTPVDIAKFNEVARLFREGNQEGFNQLFGQLIGAYDETAVREILGQLGVRWAGQ